MTEQFFDNLFQTSLYFYSALFQADAAILAFGTVFVIFKLQSLDSLKQSIIQAYYSYGAGAAQNINSLLLSTDPNEIAKTLARRKKESEYHYQNYLYIVLIPAKSAKISLSIKWPIKVIALHTIVSSLLLLVNQFIYHCVFGASILLLISFAWFAYGIYLASSLAISLLTKSDSYQLEELRPDIYKCMQEIEKTKI